MAFPTSLRAFALQGCPRLTRNRDLSENQSLVCRNSGIDERLLPPHRAVGAATAPILRNTIIQCATRLQARSGAGVGWQNSFVQQESGVI